MLILDKERHDRLRRLAPHLGTLDLNEPRKISGNLTIPPPVIATMMNWLDHGYYGEGK